MKHEEQIILYESVDKDGWKDGEIRTYEFIDNGRDFDHPEYGVSYVYHVQRRDDGFDPNKDKTLYIRPKSALEIAFNPFLAQKNYLNGRIFEFKKLIPVKNDRSKDRYELKEIFKA